MLRARQAVESHSWSHPQEPTTEEWWADVLADPRVHELLATHGASCPMPSLLERLAAPGCPKIGSQWDPVRRALRRAHQKSLIPQERAPRVSLTSSRRLHATALRGPDLLYLTQLSLDQCFQDDEPLASPLRHGVARVDGEVQDAAVNKV